MYQNIESIQQLGLFGNHMSFAWPEQSACQQRSSIQGTLAISSRLESPLMGCWEQLYPSDPNPQIVHPQTCRSGCVCSCSGNIVMAKYAGFKGGRPYIGWPATPSSSALEWKGWSYGVLRLKAFLHNIHNSASRPFRFAGLASGHHDGKSSSSLLETASQIVSIP